MLFIMTSKIKHSTVGSSFSVTLSAPPEEVSILLAVYDVLKTMDMHGFEVGDEFFKRFRRADDEAD